MRLALAEVYNDSMLPTLRPRDQLLVVHGARVRPGAVVVLRHPHEHDLLVVKRAVERRPDGWWVLSDNARMSNDSREFGAVPDEFLVARALLRLRPPRRTQPSWTRSALDWLRSAVRPLPSRSRRLRAR
ncbi:nickel-type superoxide dismutase maturation protease [Streptomyces sp. YIM 98790]|uniref:nickel-type superoxide dismutase maturation protease n=1 Tax=Streptomyces sp. YIM 98790 TaxID=2689077 RepID=UPI0028BE7D3A|nr:nickel-type superoxide dismutase maturation protease [Streptomyces sp. YIM 98790]